MVDPTYSLDDPRQRARESPYTFFLPSDEEIQAVRPGDIVKLIFRPIPPDREYDAERMWVEVKSIDSSQGSGELVTQATDMPQLNPGEVISFELYNIIGISFADPSRVEHLARNKRDYWYRCMVDRCVIDDGVPIYYVYREQPDLDEPDDEYPDSGWRIRGDYRGLSDDDLEARKATYVAIGAVLNADDSWLPLIDAPIGSAFLRDFETGKCLPADDPA